MLVVIGEPSIHILKSCILDNVRFGGRSVDQREYNSGCPLKIASQHWYLIPVITSMCRLI